MDVKLCKFCDPPTPKPLTEFYKNPRTKDGLSSKCKDCEKKYHKSKYSIKRSHRKSNLKLNYGITIQEFDRMYKEQNGLCAICFERTKLVIDHDHTTAFVRGLLCSACNHGLGRFKDSIMLLKNAIKYLEYSDERQHIITLKLKEEDTR